MTNTDLRLLLCVPGRKLAFPPSALRVKDLAANHTSPSAVAKTKENGSLKMPHAKRKCFTNLTTGPPDPREVAYWFESLLQVKGHRKREAHLTPPTCEHLGAS